MILRGRGDRIRLWGAVIDSHYVYSEIGCFKPSLGEKQTLLYNNEKYKILLPKHLQKRLSTVLVQGIKLKRDDNN